MTGLVGRVALGVASLSFDPRDRVADVATIRAGIAAGTAILDTARAYAHVDAPLYGEELAAEAAQGTDVIAGTKGGHSRTGATSWDADISAPRIRSDVETSLRVFGGEQLDLFYLHRVDLAEQPVEEGRVFAIAVLGRGPTPDGRCERAWRLTATPATAGAPGFVAGVVGGLGCDST